VTLDSNDDDDGGGGGGDMTTTRIIILHVFCVFICNSVSTSMWCGVNYVFYDYRFLHITGLESELKADIYATRNLSLIFR